MKSYAFLVTLTLGLAVQIFGHDLIPPPWRAQATTYTWGFDSAANPAVANSGYPAQIQLGPYSSGYLWDLDFGTNTGYWDLGKTGTVSIVITDATMICIQSTEWYDGGIFGQFINVVFPGATFVSEQFAVVEDTEPFGSWMIHQSIWNVPANGTLVLTAPLNGTVIDSLVIDTLPLLPETTTVCVESATSVNGPWSEVPGTQITIPRPVTNLFFRMKFVR